MICLVCPICGRQYRKWTEHKCDERTLAAIDRMMVQDRDTVRTPTESQRLEEGFALLDDADPPDREYDVPNRQEW